LLACAILLAGEKRRLEKLRATFYAKDIVLLLLSLSIYIKNSFLNRVNFCFNEQIVYPYDYPVLKYLPINRIPDEKQLMSVTEKLANELEEQSKQLDELRENV